MADIRDENRPAEAIESEGQMEGNAQAHGNVVEQGEDIHGGAPMNGRVMEEMLTNAPKATTILTREEGEIGNDDDATWAAIVGRPESWRDVIQDDLEGDGNGDQAEMGGNQEIAVLEELEIMGGVVVQTLCQQMRGLRHWWSTSMWMNTKMRLKLRWQRFRAEILGGQEEMEGADIVHEIPVPADQEIPPPVIYDIHVEADGHDNAPEAIVVANPEAQAHGAEEEVAGDEGAQGDEMNEDKNSQDGGESAQGDEPEEIVHYLNFGHREDQLLPFAIRNCLRDLNRFNDLGLDARDFITTQAPLPYGAYPNPAKTQRPRCSDRL